MHAIRINRVSSAGAVRLAVVFGANVAVITKSGTIEWNVVACGSKRGCS